MAMAPGYRFSSSICALPGQSPLHWYPESTVAWQA
jgi:hypothetical protein